MQIKKWLLGTTLHYFRDKPYDQDDRFVGIYHGFQSQLGLNLRDRMEQLCSAFIVN